MSQDIHRRKSKKTKEPQEISSKGDEKKEGDEIGTLDKYLPKSLADFIYVKLWEPHPASSLASFRICWGLIMCWEMLTWLMNGFSKVNYLLSLRTSFKYYGFEWVTPWPGYGLHAHIVINTILSLCVAFGFKYKIASFLYFLGFSYLFLLEMTLYLNHFYLVAIMCLMFIFLPADCYWSVDAALDEKKKSKTVPFWTIWVLRTFIGVVYVYAGIAKINEDWFRAEPLLHWLPRRREIPILGYFFVQPWLAYLFSLGGLVLDLFLPFALWIPTIRPLAFVCCVFFHVMNKIIFNIGIFPWVMLASTAIHFETDWLIWIGQVWQGRRKVYEKPRFPYQPRRKLNFKQKLIVISLILFFTQQILTPLRHWTYPGNVNWTEEGHRWSWRMKLRDKDASAKFFARDPVTKNNHEVDLNYWLGYKQYRKMSCRPELIHLFAHRVAHAWNESTGHWPKVTAEVICSLNYRPYQHMVKPDYDLASIPPWTWPQEWVYPLVPLGDVNNSLIVKNFTTESRKFANQYFYDHLGD